MHRGMAGIALGATVSMTACFNKPDRPLAVDDAGAHTDADSATSDGAQLDSGSDTYECLVEEFDGAIDGCGPWGTASSSANGAVTQSASQLRLSLAAEANAFVRCSSAPRDVRRLTISMNQVIATEMGGETTFVGVTQSGGSKRWGLEFAWDLTNARVAWSGLCPSGGASTNQAWNPSTQRVLRIERTATQIVLSMATTDAGPFGAIGSCSSDATFDAAVVQVGAMRGTSVGTPGTATFDRLEICR